MPRRAPSRVRGADADVGTSTVAARTTSLAVALVGAVVLVGLAAWLVPWGNGVRADPALAHELFTDPELARSEHYAVRARWWSWSSLVVSLAYLSVLGLSRLGPALMARLPGRWSVRVLLGVFVVLAGRRLLTLPFSVGAWQLRRDGGLSTQSAAGLARDVATGFAVDAVVSAAVVLLVVGLGRRWPVRWTLVAAPVAAAAVVVGSLAYPLVVEPLSHDFTPLAEGPLRDRIEAVAAAEGVRLDDVVVADASRRTTTLNAWVSGLGPTRRVVLYDNLVEDVDADEVLVIVAHELAHARHDDVLVGTAIGAAGAVVGVGLLGWLLVSGRATRRGTGTGTVASVPLLLALLALGTQLSAPVQNGISRHLERRADVTSLEMTADPGAFVEVQVELARRSLADPTPPRASQWWWGSHPGVLERVTLARERVSRSLR